MWQTLGQYACWLDPVIVREWRQLTADWGEDAARRAGMPRNVLAVTGTYNCCVLACTKWFHSAGVVEPRLEGLQINSNSGAYGS